MCGAGHSLPAMQHEGAIMTKQPDRAADGHDPKTNRLLAALDPADYDALVLEAKVVPLKLNKELHRQDERVDAVYFPLTSMVCLVVNTDGKPQMEMAMIGKEGVVGASEILQVQGSMGLNVIQLPGTALRIKAPLSRQFIRTRPLV